MATERTECRRTVMRDSDDGNLRRVSPNNVKEVQYGRCAARRACRNDAAGNHCMRHRDNIILNEHTRSTMGKAIGGNGGGEPGTPSTDDANNATIVHTVKKKASDVLQIRTPGDGLAYT